MKYSIVAIIMFLGFHSLGQEMGDNLFATLHTSSLHLFRDSEMQRMTVTTYRSSEKNGTVVETETTYRKGKISPEKIRYSIQYSEYYILEDRKRSLGIYHISGDQLFDRYERTDFNRRNVRTWTYQHDYYYQNEVLSKEAIRTIEYMGEGSVEVDTTHYLDSTLYTVAVEGGTIKQQPDNDPTAYSSFIIENNRLIKRINHFEGFDETFSYQYDDNGFLVKIENILKDEEGRNIATRTELSYADGLLKESKFFDQNNNLLERKEFDYK